MLENKVGLIFGVANKRSIAWACASACGGQGAKQAFTYQSERLKESVEDLAATLPDSLVLPCDVSDQAQVDATFDAVKAKYGKLDFLIHSIAFAPKEALEGEFVTTTREAFTTALQVSAFSLTQVSLAAAPLMTEGGSIVTMSYYGAEKVVMNYNVMGVAKAALEAAVRYIAAELGPKGIRVHAISPGPLATRAASGIPEFDELMDKAQSQAPARSLVSIEDVGNATAFLALDGAKLITGSVLYIDGGYHIID